jgi:hypothetical protein
MIEYGFALPIPGKICSERADHLVAWGAFDDIKLPCREFEVKQDPKLEAGDGRNRPDGNFLPGSLLFYLRQRLPVTSMAVAVEDAINAIIPPIAAIPLYRTVDHIDRVAPLVVLRDFDVGAAQAEVTPEVFEVTRLRLLSLADDQYTIIGFTNRAAPAKSGGKSRFPDSTLHAPSLFG